MRCAPSCAPPGRSGRRSWLAGTWPWGRPTGSPCPSPATPAGPATGPTPWWREQTGRTLELSAVHVGLEPSVFRAKAPGLVMASAGPDILDAHSVDERAPLDGLPDYALLLAGAMEAL